jgi:hypothetical protein
MPKKSEDEKRTKILRLQEAREHAKKKKLDWQKKKAQDGDYGVIGGTKAQATLLRRASERRPDLNMEDATKQYRGDTEQAQAHKYCSELGLTETDEEALKMLDIFAANALKSIESCIKLVRMLLMISKTYKLD